LAFGRGTVGFISGAIWIQIWKFWEIVYWDFAVRCTCWIIPWL